MAMGRRSLGRLVYRDANRTGRELGGLVGLVNSFRMMRLPGANVRYRIGRLGRYWRTPALNSRSAALSPRILSLAVPLNPGRLRIISQIGALSQPG
jgi:hypothetical protein